VKEKGLEVAGGGVYALCSGSEREECSVHGFLDGLVRSTKTVMTRLELGGTLYLVALIAVFLSSLDEGDKSS
jgi:hypothetical protein